MHILRHIDAECGNYCIRQAVNIYKKYHNILNDVETINELQFYYLIDCMEHDEEVDKKELSGLDEIGNIYWNDTTCCFPNSLKMKMLYIIL